MTTSTTSTSTTSSTSSTTSTTSTTSSTTTTLPPVTSSNFYSNIFKHIYTFVNEHVTDPKIATRSKWIWTTMPEKKIDDRDFYPVIVIGTPDNIETPLLTLDQKRAFPSIFVEIYSTNKEQRDTLSDTLNSALITNSDTIAGYNMESMGLSSTNDEFQRSRFTVFQRRFRLEFISEGF